jgi:3-phosphoshikimate 1-carboxyvinyltransferase
MQPILDALIQLGVQAHSSKGNGTPPIIVRGGGIKGGTTSIDGSISSQFVSGILIAGIQADSNIIMKVKGDLISKPYVLATLAIMKHFGGPVDHTQDMLEYYIKSARYNSTQFEIPSDFSSAALILAAGVLVGEKIQLNGLSFTLPQGDSQIIEILQRMGCRIMVDRMNGNIQIDGSEHLDGGNFNLADTPDLLPVVSVLALKAKSPVTIKGVAHARLKETDRVANLAKELVKFGASIEELPDGLKIMAPFDIKNASLQAYNDHRLFMALTIASMMTQKSIVAGAESVDVSYPNFLSDMRALGADISPAPDRE